MTMLKSAKYHHSVTENGNIQVRLVTEYLKDGKLIDKKYGDPYTPADTKDMTGWDDRSKAIVAAITDSKVLIDFAGEALALYEEYVKGVEEGGDLGIQEVVSYDRVIEEDGKIAVRRITRIFDEGVEVSKKYHRSWIMPGQDPTGNDVMSKAIAKKIHTPKVIVDYKAKIATQAIENEPIKVTK
ncbi:MAG: hypothetical protein Q7J85_07095 [Bacillota bacterium]|nr:hypothetical protein [Bacillota bacterium]